MVLWANTLHFYVIIDEIKLAVHAYMILGIIVLVVGADCTVITIEIGIRWWAIVAFSLLYIVNLLGRTVFTSHISIIPILRMLAFHTNLSIPIQILCLITGTSFQLIVISSASCALQTLLSLLILALRTK